MNEYLEYQGYKGTIKWSEEDHCFHGLIQNIRGSFSYEGENLEELEKDFQLTVHDYIEFRKKYPEKISV